MLIQLKAPRSAGGYVVTQREVPVGVRIAPARSNMRRVEHISIHEVDVGAQAVIPFRMTLFDVLAPEVGAFEELGAVFGNFAAVLVKILLLHEL